MVWPLLTHLTVGGFKSFAETNEIELAPITLIYGANSSGKSSILQALLLLKQTIQQTNPSDAALQFRNVNYVDLGSFENTVFSHNKKRTIQIGVGFSKATTSKGSVKRRSRWSSDIDHARTVIEFVSDPRRGAAVYAIAFYLNNEPFPAFSLRLGPAEDPNSGEAESLDLQPSPSKIPDRRFKVDLLDKRSSVFAKAFKQFERSIPGSIKRLERDIAQLETLSKGDRGRSSQRTRSYATFKDQAIAQKVRLETYNFDRFLDDVKKYANSKIFEFTHFLPSSVTPVLSVTSDAVEDYFSDGYAMVRARDTLLDIPSMIMYISRQIRDEFEALSYIGPLREYPERTYIFSGSQSRSVGTRGQYLPDILFSDPALNDALNERAKSLGINYDISVSKARSKTLTDVFAVRLTDKQTKINVGLSDVGFGISQVLPVLLQSCLRPGVATLIEQPEIHLHPKLQAALGEVLQRAINDEANRQFIVETHSEHLFLRLQRLVRSGHLASDKLKVLFVDRTDSGARVVELRLDKSGNLLDRWPNGFFDDRFRELFEGSAFA